MCGRLSCVRTGMPWPGLASRFLVSCFLGPSGFGWKSSIFTGWGRENVQEDGGRSLSRKTGAGGQLKNSRAAKHTGPSRQWCRSQTGASRGERQRREGWARGKGAMRLGGERRRTHLAEGHRAGKGRVRDGTSPSRVRRGHKVWRGDAQSGANAEQGGRRHAAGGCQGGAAAAGWGWGAR